MGGNDNKINKTLFQIIPYNSKDQYRISFCYVTKLYEIFDHKGLNHEQLDLLYAKAFNTDENTKFISIKDSLKYFFPFPLSADDNEREYYSNAFMTKSFYKNDLERVKKKYALSDTLVMFSGEGGATYARLTKDKRLFGYDADAYLFKIERLQNNKLIESKYVVIYISYGC